MELVDGSEHLKKFSPSKDPLHIVQARYKALYILHCLHWPVRRRFPTLAAFCIGHTQGVEAVFQHR